MIKVYCGKSFKFNSGKGIEGSASCGMFMLWCVMQCEDCIEKEKRLNRTSEVQKG